MNLNEIFKKQEFKPFKVKMVNEEFKLRCYNTEEEKDLFLAKSISDEHGFEEAIIDLIEKCCNKENLKKYPKIVIAELAKNLRIISNSSNVFFSWKCLQNDCNADNDNEKFDLTSVSFDTNMPKLELKIENDGKEILLKFKLPSFEEEEELHKIKMKDLPDDFFSLPKEERQKYKDTIKKNMVSTYYLNIAIMLNEVITKEDNFNNLNIQEKIDFVNSMPKKVFAEITAFLDSVEIPKIEVIKKDCKCKKCGEVSSVRLGKGLKSFFEF